jgi:TonB-dependent receptor
MSGRTSGVLGPEEIYRSTIKTSGFIPGFGGAGALPPGLLVYSLTICTAISESLGNPQAQTIPGFNYGCCNYTGSLDIALDAGSVQDITEKTWAAFLSTHFNGELGGKPFHVTAGLRREKTDVSSSGIGRLPVLLEISEADPTLLTTTFSDPQPITTDSDYAYLLPSLDIKMELTEELQVRVDASRTLTRPRIDYLSPVLNVGSLPRIGALTATGNNPALKPYLSDNLDLGVEWYYGRNAYVSVNAFIKDVTGFIVQGTQRQTINDVIDPSTGQPAIYTVSQRVNGPEATVNGWEIAWQHIFGDSGFGFNANATFVDTDKPYDRTDISLSGFAVTGLADSANLVAFFDKYGFEGAYRGELAR